MTHVHAAAERNIRSVMEHSTSRQMTEKIPKLEQEEKDKPNLIQNFDECVNVVVEIESKLSREIGLKEKQILRGQMGDALGSLMEQGESLSEEDLKRFRKRVVSGFQGLGGFNRYIVRGDGSIGLKQSHSTGPCIEKAQELGIETPEYGF